VGTAVCSSAAPARAIEIVVQAPDRLLTNSTRSRIQGRSAEV
jgi:hypothetical protein